MVEDDGARVDGGQHAVSSAQNLLHDAVAHEAERHDVGIARRGSGVCPRVSAHRSELLHLALTAIHDRHRLPGLHEVDSHGLAHHAKPHESDAHSEQLR